MFIQRNGFVSDAEGCGKVIVEILSRRKHKVWSRVLTSDAAEIAYLTWLATWTGHWGRLALRHGGDR
jgi:hypothetical protein